MKYIYNEFNNSEKIREGSYIVLSPSALKKVGWDWLHHNDFKIIKYDEKAGKVLVKMHNKKYDEDAQFWFKVSDITGVVRY